ncbi:hypothetical protein ABZ619_09155 [Streptomyces sp. NPDC007851]|uniref:hypothetical protein n=1 Tax=Streptomyces sp. NPDC007851 TaxID=3155008 RepID=UPI0033E67967
MIFDKLSIVGGFREPAYGSADGSSIRAAARMAAPAYEGDLVGYLRAGTALSPRLRLCLTC